jgi:hypothetical protein
MDLITYCPGRTIRVNRPPKSNSVERHLPTTRLFDLTQYAMPLIYVPFFNLISVP